MYRNLAVGVLYGWIAVASGGALMKIGEFLKSVAAILEEFLTAGCGCLMFIVILVILVALVKFIWTSLP